MNRTRLLTFLAFIFTAPVWANIGAECKLAGNPVLYHNANVDTQSQYPYKLEAPLRTNQIPGTRVFDCLKAAQKRKWLLVGFGPQEYGYDVNDQKVFFDDVLQPNYCELKGTTFAVKSFEERQKDFQKKLNFNNKCLLRRVHHISRYPLRFQKNQKYCKLTRINDREYYLQGGLCFFMIFPDSQFVFSYEMNQKCLDRNYLIQNNISPMEVKSYTTYNVVANPSGNTDDFTLLGSRSVHARLDPTEGMGDLTDANGMKYPTYFQDYEVPVHDLSNIELREDENNGQAYIKATMLVNNNCKQEICDGKGLCTNRCNFQRPFVSQFILSELTGRRKPYYLHSWYEGGVTPPNWQGAISTDFRQLDGIKFKTGHRYQVDVKFRDPKNDFIMLARGRNPLFRTIPGLDSTSFAKALTAGIPSIDDLGLLIDIPTIDGLGDIDEGRDIGSLNSSISYLTQNSMWPPYYRDVCKSGNPLCVSSGRKTWLEYSVSFIVGDFDADTQRYKIKNIKVNQKSNLFGNKSRPVSRFPKVECPE